MKLNVVATALILSLTTSATFAAVAITAPEEIVIVAVNDQEVNAGLMRTKQNNYQINSGENTISVRYQEFFEHLDGEHDIVKSGVVTLKTPVLQDRSHYRLSLVDAPQNYDAAKQYAQKPVIGLYNDKNQLIVKQVGVNTESKPWFGNNIFTKTINLMQSKPQVQPEAVYPSNDHVNGNQPLSQENNGNQLIELWKNSSKAERQKFMNWMAEQSN